MIVKTYITHAQLNFRKVFIIRQSSRFILLFLFYFSGFELPLRGLGSFAYAQTHPPLDSASLAEKPEFTDLKEALQNPLEVYTLSLAYQELTELPSSILQFKNLQILDCSSNQLTSLPHTIGELKNLQILNCSSNQLTSLPHTIGTLKNLQILNVSSNPLTTVPVEIGNLSQLKELDISEAEITQPIDERLFPFLEKLDFGGNITIALQAGKTLQERNANVRKAQSIAENKIRREREHALKQSKLAQINSQIANEQQMIANQERQKAHLAYLQAKKFRQESEREKLNALSQSEIANSQRKIAEQQKNQADESRSLALSEKQKALEAEYEAKNNEKKALIAEKEAREAEAQAQTQRNMALGIGIVAVLLGIFALYQMSIAHKQRKIAHHEREIANEERIKAEKLLLNILPVEIAEELKANGIAPPPQLYKSASVMFTDYSGFTEATERNPMAVVLQDLNECFVGFDRITAKYGIEKIKTIGDAFMCAKGIPTPCNSHAVDMVLSGLEMQRFMIDRKRQKDAKGEFCFQCRLGINSGEVIAGVVGERKFCYDIWGNTVNTANRMELSGKVERVNISSDTMELVKDFFELESREPIQVKGKGIMQLYFVLRIKPELSQDKDGIYTNDAFKDLYKQKFGKVYNLPV